VAGIRRRLTPALALLLIAALVAEFLLGDVTLASLGALVVFIPLYGAGALLIREIVRRRGGGWPSILMLAAAFGVVEEGLATQSLFNPDYANAQLLDAGYLPALGIAIPWTVHVLSLHVIWSIATPIALVESLFPARRTTPWLRTPGLIAVMVLYVFGVGFAAVNTWATYRFLASPGQIVGVSAVAAGLATAGMRVTTRHAANASPQLRSAPPAWVVGLLAALGTSLLVIAPQVPTALGSVAIFLVVEACAAIMITLWSRRPGWCHRHVLALAAAALFAYAWRAFFSTPAFDTASLELARISNITFAALALAVVLLALRRTAHPTEPRRGRLTEAAAEKYPRSAMTTPADSEEGRHA
jgi:hypothetical protein